MKKMLKASIIIFIVILLGYVIYKSASINYQGWTKTILIFYGFVIFVIAYVYYKRSARTRDRDAGYKSIGKASKENELGSSGPNKSRKNTIYDTDTIKTTGDFSVGGASPDVNIGDGIKRVSLRDKLSQVGKNVFGKRPRRFSSPKMNMKKDLINFSVYSPKKFKVNSPIILDVWAYLNSDISKVKRMAKDLGRAKSIGTKTGVVITQGSLLQIKLNIPYLQIEDPIDYITWNGVPANASFIIRYPKDTDFGYYSGTAIVSCDGISISKISFNLSIEKGSSKNSTSLTFNSHLHEKAFVSYATKDKEEVLSRVQGMKKVAPDLDVFMDSFSLKSGEDWMEKLEENIAKRDVFYLFWSIPASESEMVATEWKLALKTKGIEYIDPIPLEDPEICPPPKELNSLHFNDIYMTNIKYHQFKKSNKSKPK